jgi:hypothetical protein
MPLFRSNAQLGIHLDQPSNSLFTPGAEISGTVRLFSVDDESVDSIYINFLGTSDTEILKRRSNTQGNTTTTIVYRDHVPLFSYGIRLFDGPYTLPGNRNHEWRFKFTFPHNTLQDRHGVYQSASSQIWLTAPHPLPPNFADGASDYGRIGYTLEAFLDRKFKSVQTAVPLNYSPLRIPRPLPPPLTYGNTFNFTSSRLQAGREDKRRSIKEALTDRFSSNTPSIKFQLLCTVPNTVISDSTIPVSLRLTIDNSSSTALIIPSYTISLKELYLECYTHIRAPRESAFYISTRAEEDEILQSEFSLPNSWADKILTRNEKDLGDPIDVQVKVPAEVCPSFRSYAVTRSYRLRIKVKIECAGEKFDGKYDVPNFSVLPFCVAPQPQVLTPQPQMDLPHSQGSEAQISFTDQTHSTKEATDLDEEQLPSYDSAVNK